MNALVCELIAILGVNGFASHEVKIKVRVLDPYILLLCALKVHLDPRLNGIPKHTMTEARRSQLCAVPLAKPLLGPALQ
ncbi:MAG: hypothetical protein WB679_14050 [Terracidiphilus sp.]